MNPQPGQNTTHLSIVDEIDLLCDEFERAWTAGPRPRIEDFLTRVLESNRSPALRELLGIELERRRNSGEQPNVDDYLARFPGYRELILESFLRGPTPRSVNCPHCQSPVEVGESAASERVCRECGSSFHLDPGSIANTPLQLPSIAKFELLASVGRGGFGAVYRARDTELDRIVAIKIPRNDRLATPEEEERFLREARVLAQLRHPAIIPVYEVGRSGGVPYLVTEFVDGINLEDASRLRQFPFRESAELVSQIADALEHAHQLGVVHRDIKPSNVMLDHVVAHSQRPLTATVATRGDSTHGNSLPASDLGESKGSISAGPRIMDFGLALRLDCDQVTITTAGRFLGTVAYASPEQARETHQVDGRTDIYSLGVVLFKLLTGELPFRGSMRMILYQIEHDEPRPLRKLNDSIPKDLETITLKCLSKEPSRRYQTAADLAADLRRWFSGEPIAARPVGHLERAGRWCRRNPRVAIPSGLALLSLLAVSCVSSWAYFKVSHQNRLISSERDKAQKHEQSANYNLNLARIAQAKSETDSEKAKRQEGIAKERAGVAKQQAELVMKNMQLVISQIDLRLSETPGTLDARLAILETVVKAWDQIDPSVRDDEEGQAAATVMAARMKLGRVYQELGKLDLAEQELMKLHEMGNRRIEVKKGNDASRRNMISICLMLGSLRKKINRDLESTLKYFNEAIAWARDIDEHPKPDSTGAPKKYEVKHVLSEALQRVASVHHSHGRFEQAGDYFRQALEIREQLLLSLPTDPEFCAEPELKRKLDLKEIHASYDKSILGQVYVTRRLGDEQSARRLIESAYSRRKQNHLADQDDIYNKLEYANLCGAYGEFLLWNGQSDGESIHETEVTLLKDLVAANQTNSTYKSYLASAHYRFGLFLDEVQDKRASEQFQTCCVLREAIAKVSRNNQIVQAEWMMALARCGMVDQAFKMATELGNNPKSDSELQLHCSRAFAQTSRFASGSEQSASLRNDALDALDRAIRDGYKDSYTIQHDPDFKPLRNDPRFAAAIATISAHTVPE